MGKTQKNIQNTETHRNEGMRHALIEAKHTERERDYIIRNTAAAVLRWHTLWWHHMIRGERAHWSVIAVTQLICTICEYLTQNSQYFYDNHVRCGTMTQFGPETLVWSQQRLKCIVSISSCWCAFTTPQHEFPFHWVWFMLSASEKASKVACFECHLSQSNHNNSNSRTTFDFKLNNIFVCLFMYRSINFLSLVRSLASIFHSNSSSDKYDKTHKHIFVYECVLTNTATENR